MQSCLYECRVMHARLFPKRHRFEYGVFMLWLDLDELPTLHRTLRLLRINQAGLFSFFESDHIRHDPSCSLKENIVAFARRQGLTQAISAVRVLVLPKILGYLFHPFSAFFLYSETGEVVGSIAQVTNTFWEQKWYWVPVEASSASSSHETDQPRTTQPLLRWRGPKHFYVSPFTGVEVEFEFQFRPPTEKFAFSVDDWTDGRKTLVTTFRGDQQPLTDLLLLRYFFRYPLLTLRIMLLIHWHALLLYWKKIPYFAKTAQADLQRDVYHPHISIAPKTTKT